MTITCQFSTRKQVYSPTSIQPIRLGVIFQQSSGTFQQALNTAMSYAGRYNITKKTMRLVLDWVTSALTYLHQLGLISDIYLEDRFIQVPLTTLLISTGSFLFFALPWTLLSYLDPKWAQPYKIQQKPFQVKRYFLPCMTRIFINSLIMLVLLFISWPLLRLSGIHSGELPSAWLWGLQLVFFLFLDDFLFYWMHRYLHENKWLLRHVHSVHHRIKNTCALDGNYFHWVEFVLIGGLAMVGPILVGTHIYVLYSWIVLRNLEAADGHAGYDFPWNPLRYLPFYDGPVYHDFHHARFKGNYAGALDYLDGLFNTYIKDYLTYQYKRPLLWMKSSPQSSRISPDKLKVQNE